MTQTSRALVDTRAIWAIAIPSMISNVATALIGLGDMWIVGQLGDAPTQGAVEVGARLFAMLFTVMIFLKFGTTALVAQDGTREGPEAQARTLARGLVVGLTIAALLLLAKPLLEPALLHALGARGRVLEAATTYVDIRYWAAPGVLANLALVGFLIGRRQVKAALVIEVGYNLVNVALGVWLALHREMGIAGIGWSSLVAEYVKLAAVLLVVLRGPTGAHILSALSSRANLRWTNLAPFLGVNRDLFLRSVILMVAFAAVTRLGAERGPVVLAANGILFQLFVLQALILDGFENAAQVLCGERLGAADRVGFERMTRAIVRRGFAGAAVLAGFFLVAIGTIIANFAATPEVAWAALAFAPWLVIMPFAGAPSFVYDGVYVGASWTRALLGTMAGAALVYAVLLVVTWPMGNDGLWLSFFAFLVARAVLQRLALPRLAARIGDDPDLQRSMT